MKKIIVFALTIFVFGTLSIFPCIMSFSPEKIKIEKGVEKEVILKVKYEHRKCEITINDTEYETKGVKIISKSEWRKIRRGLYEQTIKIILESDKGYLRAYRECTKKGISEAVLKVYSK